MGYNTRKNNYIQVIHQELYKEKEQIKVRKEKETENRKRAREKIEETKLLEGENKKLKQLEKRKTKDPLRKAEESSLEESSPLKNVHRASGLKFRQNLKELVCDESSTDEYQEFLGTEW